MKIIELNSSHEGLLIDFCRSCEDIGFKNNSSLEAIKWNDVYDLKSPPSYWGLMHNDKLVSISGSHFFGWQSDDVPQIRCLFRSATLPKHVDLIPGLSKNHMNSIPFSLLLPYQIIKGLESGTCHFYITTSHGAHDASGKMKRTHQAITLLSKRRIVDFISEEIIYSTPQTKWKIVLPNYFNAVKHFEKARKNLKVTPELDYNYIDKLMNNFQNINYGIDF
jgi:hypothetical protein